MAAVHLTTTYESYMAHKVQEKPFFLQSCPCAYNIVYAGFQDSRISLYGFSSVV